MRTDDAEDKLYDFLQGLNTRLISIIAAVTILQSMNYTYQPH
jgi:hypothetical protein